MHSHTYTCLSVGSVLIQVQRQHSRVYNVHSHTGTPRQNQCGLCEGVILERQEWTNICSLSLQGLSKLLYHIQSWNLEILVYLFIHAHRYWCHMADERLSDFPQCNQQPLVVKIRMNISGELGVSSSMECDFPFSALTLLVG